MTRSFPVSARTGSGLDPLIARLAELMPDGPYLYPPEEHTDSASETHLAELIREQILRRTRAEIPHAVEVIVEGAELRDDGLFEVRAQVWVEAESQKAILIGRGGRMVRDIGTAARRELERELGGQVYLDLRVRVRERWRRDDGLLDRLGYRMTMVPEVRTTRRTAIVLTVLALGSFAVAATIGNQLEDPLNSNTASLAVLIVWCVLGAGAAITAIVDAYIKPEGEVLGLITTIAATVFGLLSLLVVIGVVVGATGVMDEEEPAELQDERPARSASS